MDTLQTNTTTISEALCVDGQKLWHWYRDFLSGFWEAPTQEGHYRHDIEVDKGGKKELVRIPILKPENIGPNMAIDEKQIGEDMHTLLTNRDTGKLAMLARSVSAEDLQKAIASVGNKVDIVETITRDLSPTYEKFGNSAFPNASHIADKFHIVRELLECCQEVRVRYRQEALKEKRLKYEEHKKIEKQRKESCAKENETYSRKNFIYEEPILSNGETTIEALARSRFLLFKYRGDWTANQKTRALALFEKYPEIEAAHELACGFRDWIKRENIGREMATLRKELREWFKKVEQEGVEELLNFKSMIERNLLEVSNYFRFGATNAIAENMNSRIQRFVMINQGTRDREFFYFRVANYFA